MVRFRTSRRPAELEPTLIFFADDAADLGRRYANTNMSSPVKDTPPTFAEQQMLEKQRRYSQLLDDEGSDEVAGYTLTLVGCAPVVVRHDVSTQHTLSWDPVKSKSGDVILESGLCNLYIFPKVTLDDDNDAVDYLGGARGSTRRWRRSTRSSTPFTPPSPSSPRRRWPTTSLES